MEYDTERDCAEAEARWAMPEGRKFRWSKRQELEHLTDAQRADVYALRKIGYTFNQISFMRGFDL